MATSDDSPSRLEILRIAKERATTNTATPFEAVTYVGDGPWDITAAREMDFQFVGVACDGDEGRLRSAGASLILSDFSNGHALVNYLVTGEHSDPTNAHDRRVLRGPMAGVRR